MGLCILVHRGVASHPQIVAGSALHILHSCVLLVIHLTGRVPVGFDSLFDVARLMLDFVLNASVAAVVLAPGVLERLPVQVALMIEFGPISFLLFLHFPSMVFFHFHHGALLLVHFCDKFLPFS